MRFNFVLWTVLLQIALLIYSEISFAGTWRDDFEDNVTREWKIYNLDRQVEKWWINKGEAVGEIFHRGFISLWLTGDLTWKNYSISCRAKLVKEKNDPASMGLSLYDRSDESSRYLFSVNVTLGTASIIKAAPNQWFTRDFPFVADIDTWYHLKATVNEEILEFRVGNQVFLGRDPDPLEPGQAGLVVSNARVRFDDVEITGDKIKGDGPGRPRAVDLNSKLATTWGQIKSDQR